jgi:membrane-bound lytic murein transglycosylase A
LVCALCLGLASCRSSRLDDRLPFRKSEKKMQLQQTSFRYVAGWSDDDLKPALEAFKRSCIKIMNEGDFVASSQIVISADFMKQACSSIPEGEITASMARAYFEFWFDPYLVSTLDGETQGTVTSYYESELDGSVEATCDYLVPIYGRPSDLPSNGSKYFTRRQIENGSVRASAPVLFWAKSFADVHILQIQGSGMVRTPDGKSYRIGYAGNNGYKFSGIGSILKRNNVDVGGGYSMVNVKKWLDAHPAEAKKYMQENDRFIFFRDIVGEGPVGAMGVPLTPRRSVAVDPEYIPLGLPLFLDTYDPDHEKIQSLVVAQDVGAAIKGAVRADFFWGSGNDAFAKAGRMKSSGSYHILLPKDGKNFAVKK